MTIDSPRHLNPDYVNLLENIKQHFNAGQSRAAIAINNELLRTYWNIGFALIQRQKEFKSVNKMIEQISYDLQQALATEHSFLDINLERMRQFAFEYPDFEKSAKFVQNLPWSQIVILLHKVNDKHQRDRYAKLSVANGWTSAELEKQIEKDLNID